MSVTIVFRTNDGAKWGTGQGSDLTPAQADVNLWNVKQAVEYIQDNPPEAVSIESISQTGDTLTVHYTDASTDGPFTLPSIPIVFRGAWVISTAYAVGDVITAGGSTYIVIYAHISDPTAFDAGENDGLGHNYYGLLLENPAGALPAGGSAGQVLTKSSSTDYAAAWASASAIRPIVNISGTTHTLAADNAGAWHRFPNVSAKTITVPANADVAIPIGSVYMLRQCGAGGMTVVEGSSGIVINGLYGFDLATDTLGATLELIKINTDEWDLVGYQVAS